MAKPQFNGRLLPVIDFEEMYRETPDPIIVNQESMTSTEFARSVAQKLFAENDTGVVDCVASCECRKTRSNILIGTICKHCGSVVKVDFVNNKEHSTWISVPERIKGVLHPVVYNVLVGWLGYGSKGAGRANLLDDIVDASAELPFELQGVVKGRGFNYLYDHFDELIDYFATSYKGTCRNPDIKYYLMFIRKYRHLIFTTKLPILAAALQPLTKKSETMRYLNFGSVELLKAVHEMCFVEFATGKIPLSEARLNRVLLQAYKSYIEYDATILIEKLSKKASLIRKHLLGARYHFSFRAVIVPIAGPHRYDELHVPWAIGVTTFRLHIINRLEKMGMSTVDAFNKHSLATVMYDPDIDKIMQKLLNDYPNPDGVKGFPVLFDRPPTLKRGSIQYLYVTKVKTDIHDSSTGISTIPFKAANADFDGDEMAGVFIIESESATRFSLLHPSERLMDENMPRVYEEICLPKQCLITLNNFLNGQGGT